MLEFKRDLVCSERSLNLTKNEQHKNHRLKAVNNKNLPGCGGGGVVGKEFGVKGVGGSGVSIVMAQNLHPIFKCCENTKYLFYWFCFISRLPNSFVL